MCDTEYDPLGNSYLETDTLNLLFLYDLFIFFHVYYIHRCDRPTYLSLF